jgi:hypothetical protein
VIERQFQKGQSFLRGFFGLGPSQFSSVDGIIPTIDIDFLLRSNQDCEIVTNSFSPVVPGAANTINISCPRAGAWLLHGFGIATSGPATSGFCRAFASLTYNTPQWATAGAFGLLDTGVIIPRNSGGVAIYVGRMLDRPVVMHRFGATTDQVTLQLHNDSTSVGNATFTVYCIFRPVEAVGVL